MGLFRKKLTNEEKYKERKQKEKEKKEKFNRRQEELDDMYKNEKQKSDFKTLLSRLKFETYTKRLVALIIFVSLIDLQLSYVLAFLGKEQIAETLSTQICLTILGTAIVYLIRAYFDTKAEKDNELIRSGIIINKKSSSIIPDDVLKNKIQEVIDNSGLGEHINIRNSFSEDEEYETENPEDESEFCG